MLAVNQAKQKPRTRSPIVGKLNMWACVFRANQPARFPLLPSSSVVIEANCLTFNQVPVFLNRYVLHGCSCHYLQPRASILTENFLCPPCAHSVPKSARL